MDPLALFTAGSGGLGAMGTVISAVITGLIFVFFAWVLLGSVREMADGAGANTVIVTAVRGAVLLIGIGIVVGLLT